MTKILPITVAIAALSSSAFAADLAFIDFHPRETLNPHRGVTLQSISTRSLDDRP